MSTNNKAPFIEKESLPNNVFTAELSYEQQRFFFLQQLNPTEYTYNEAIAFRITGALNIAILEKSFELLMARHEVLRTTYHSIDDKLVQAIKQTQAFSLNRIDLSGYLVEELQEVIQKQLLFQCQEVFDLAANPPFKVSLIQERADRFILLVVLHQIITDDTSKDILQRELFIVYRALANKEQAILPTLPIQYADYAIWQRGFLQTQNITPHLSYWEKQLADSPMLELSTDYPFSVKKPKIGVAKKIKLTTTLSKQLQALSRSENTTLFMVMLSAFKILLHRYTNQTDIAIGIISSTRNSRETENLLGVFINTLVLRSNFSDNPTIKAYLAQIKTAVLNAQKHGEVQFDKLVEHLKPERIEGRNPYFQVLFNMEAVPFKIPDIEHLNIEEFDLDYLHIDLDLNVEILLKEGVIECAFVYNANLFEATTIDRLQRYYVTVLNTMVQSSNTQVSTFNLLSVAEKQQLLYDFNDTEASFPSDKTIIDLFEEQVEKTPNNIAVVFEDTELTYRQLNEKANQLGHYLRATYDIQPDDIIALQVERSEWMMIAILGVMKSGAAYLPIAPNTPTPRTVFMLRDANAKVLLTDETTYPIAFEQKKVLGVEIVKEVKNGRKTNLKKITSSRDLAYIIYTSGSTGIPKGVMIEHKSVVNLICFIGPHLGVTSKERVLQTSSYNYDSSVIEIFKPLFCGATLILVDKMVLLTPNAIKEYLNSKQVSLIDGTPTLFSSFNKTLFKHLKIICTGGEVANMSDVRFYAEHYTYFNDYGPTECTVTSTVFVVSQYQKYLESAALPIGKPIANTQIYILDKYKQIVPIGVAGELCISGVSLARGYLNNPELTSEKFIAHPFKEGARLYKTGDLARWLPDGNIDFLGRIDQQLKIRGHRIEAGEIEQALLAHPAIQAAVVIGSEIADIKELVAYLVPIAIGEDQENLENSEQAMPDIASLRSFLSESLPDYMLPAYYMQLDSLPLTAGGKVNRKALPSPDPDSLASGINYVGPRTLVEQTLVSIWEKLLGRQVIGIHDNFFHLGGHSLRAIRLVALIHRQLGAKIKLTQIFTHPTIAQLAPEVSSQASLHPSLLRSIPTIETAENYTLSNAQRRLWVIDQMEEEQIAYNMPAAIRLNGELNVRALEQSIQLLFQRHESLRTNFVKSRQVIHSTINFNLGLTDYTDSDKQTIQSHIHKHATFPFDLSNDALLQLELLQLDKEEHILLFNMHHIISDGWSMGILFKELTALYEACMAGLEQPLSVLAPLTIQYKDYAAWQNDLLTSKEILPVRDYWLKTLAPVEGLLPVLELPTDYPRPAIKTYNGASVYTCISPDLLAKLNQLSQSKQATLFMSLTALVKILLYRYSGQRDIIIGSPIAGRNHPDLNDQIGFYVNTLVLRNQIDPRDSFVSFLDQVKTNALAAFENDLYPFDKLVEELNLPRDTSRSAVFDVMLILQNNEVVPFTLGALDVNYERRATTTSKFDLTFNFEEREESLHLKISYNTDLFKRDRIQRLGTHFETLLESVLANPTSLIEELNILPYAERQLLLEDFNDTKVDFPRDKTIIDLFEEQVEKTPNNIAIVFEDKQWTYQQLNQLTNQIAHYLIDNYAIQSDEVIALLPERSQWMPIGILAILKTGAAYLPLSKDLPPARLAFMVKDSGAKLLLTDASNEDLGKQLFSSILLLEKIQTEKIHNPNPIVISSNLAFVLYTSGSTGKPKGVMMPHQAMINLMCWQVIHSSSGIASRTAQFSSFSFDVSFQEIFATWLSGGELVLVAEAIKKDLFAFADLIVNEQIERLFLPFAALQELAIILLNHQGDLSHLKVIQTAGEQLQISEAIVQLFKRLPNCQLENHYGPTETHVVSAYTLKGNPDSWMPLPPIGQPIANTQLYILDKSLTLVPIGVTGELYIGGAGLAHGYLNLLDLSKERFIAHPFTQGERLYKTGDLARWLPDGNIEFLGRIDNQLKIRGYRIEAGEIEQALLAHPAIQSVVVIGHEAKDTKELVAYLVPTTIEKEQEAGDNSEQVIPDISMLRSFLSESLPNYMIPAYYVLLDSLPLTDSGKVNRKALPSPDQISLVSRIAYEAPRTPIQQILVELWAELLNRSSIGIHDNFFDLGGHSLRAIRLVALIQQQLSVKIKLRQIFTQPTIAALAKLIEPPEEISLLQDIKLTTEEQEKTINPNTTEIEW